MWLWLEMSSDYLFDTFVNVSSLRLAVNLSPLISNCLASVVLPFYDAQGTSFIVYHSVHAYTLQNIEYIGCRNPH